MAMEESAEPIPTPADGLPCDIWIGIDLGTTNSAMAVYDRTRGGAKWMRLLPPGLAAQQSNGKAGRLLPMVLLIATKAYVEEHHFYSDKEKRAYSWIDWEDEDQGVAGSGSQVRELQVLLGQDALDLMDADEDPVWVPAQVTSIKRKLLLQADASTAATTIEVTPAGLNHPIQVSITSILALWLQTLRTTASLYLETQVPKKKGLNIPHYEEMRQRHRDTPSSPFPCSHAVIGLPAAAPVVVKQQLRTAAHVAGWEHVEFRTESTAAAMAYGLALQDRPSTILVVDVGGGTTDITVATRNGKEKDEKASDEYQVLHSVGHTALGGDDMDEAILDYCGFLQEARKEQADPSLLRKCRRAKVDLCNETTTQADIIWQGQKVSLTLAQLEVAIQPILDRIEALVSSVLTCTMNEIIFIGGASRVPAVQRVVIQLIDTANICRSLSFASAVAQGCAIAAALHMVPRYELRNALMLDTNPHSIGVLTSSHKSSFVEILQAGVTLPARGSAVFALADPHQAGVTVQAVEVVGKESALTNDPLYSAVGEFTFLLHRPAKALDERSVEIRMLLKETGEFVVSVFDENDPEHIQRLAVSTGLTDRIEEPTPMEQIALIMGCVFVLILYVAVKLMFPEAGLGMEG